MQGPAGVLWWQHFPAASSSSSSNTKRLTPPAPAVTYSPLVSSTAIASQYDSLGTLEYISDAQKRSSTLAKELLQLPPYHSYLKMKADIDQQANLSLNLPFSTPFSLLAKVSDASSSYDSSCSSSRSGTMVSAKFGNQAPSPGFRKFGSNSSLSSSMQTSRIETRTGCGPCFLSGCSCPCRRWFIVIYFTAVQAGNMSSLQ